MCDYAFQARRMRLKARVCEGKSGVANGANAEADRSTANSALTHTTQVHNLNDAHGDLKAAKPCNLSQCR